MKKIITLMLLIGGFVGTASADWYVSGVSAVTNSSEDWGTRSENVMTSLGNNIYMLVAPSKTITAWSGDSKINYGVKFTDGTNWYGDNGNNINLNFQGDGTYTIVYYFNSNTHEYRFISTPMLRWGLGNNGSGNWNFGYEAASMLTKDGNYSWTYELTPTTFTSTTSFRLYSSLWDKQAYPTSVNLDLFYGNSASQSTKFEYTTSDNCWRITKPSYTFEKVVITATYKPFDNTNSADWGQWDISADAYVKKTIGSDLYATFGSGADVDFSKYKGPEGSVLTAKKGKVQSDGTIAWNNATTLNNAEGVLLHGTVAGDYLIPVTYPVPSTDSNNDFVAIPSAQTINPTDGSYYNYLLAHPAGKTLGFYKPYSSGTNCSAGTAYLKTTYTPSPSREYFPLWGDESSNIDEMLKTKNVDGTYYNLSGQRIVEPTKGLYIINGKKVIVR